MSNNSVIEHRANYHFVKLQEEYLHICGGNHCQALILSTLEEWTNTKKAKGQDLYVYMTYPQWVTALYGVYGRSVIISALASLEKRGLLEKRKCYRYGKETYEYLLNIKRVNDLLKALPEKLPHETHPNLDAFKNKRVQKQTRSEMDGKQPDAVYFQTGDAFKNKRNIDSITQIPNTDSLPSADADQPFLPDVSSVGSLIARLREAGYTVTPPAPPTEDTSRTQDTSTEDQNHARPATDHPDSRSATEVKFQEGSARDKDNTPKDADQGKILPFAPIKPEMPPSDMSWGPEKMVQLTECLRWCRGERGAVFARDPTGKSQKSQRDRQFASAKKILLEIPTLTESEYVQAYSDQNNEWWNREKGSLTVEDMAANTPRKVMRTVELLEKVRTRSERIKERPPSQPGSESVTAGQSELAAASASKPQNRLLTRDELHAKPIGLQLTGTK